MTIPEKIRLLVERFDENKAAYTSGKYNEAQVRQEFINPFFKMLGWDMDNEQGYAEQYKEVIHEDAIKIGGTTKAPDYAFRIGGVTKFYLEAKKPSVKLKDDMPAAFQLRRYAWTAKLPLSILTDFEEFAVYDTRILPKKTDKASTARINYYQYTEYEQVWDDIAAVFARDAIPKGSFDKYAESTKRKRGTAEVDEQFLKEIEGWRKLLAQNIALRNKDLRPRELNFAVQRTIDRVIFLRICEDRGIEDYGQLRELCKGSGVYERLRTLFHKADDRYNSGLFHFKKEKDRTESPDTLTLGLQVDDKALRDILTRLYYPDSPYEFSVLPVETLGNVYEQFLGSVITLDTRHRATVEQKPEVRKAGGVYYTPDYVVDYIVQNTVGKVLEGRKAGPRGGASKLRILDPACGSGSFLIGAYQYLLDWHRDEYVEEGPEKHKKELFQGPGGEWRLTTDEKKRILLNSIHGVDIDPQAVEVTKLSLLLKVLEGESAETIKKQLQLFHTRALPDLSENVKCGNSLISSDLYREQQRLFDENEQYRINAFDWRTEFPGIMAAGGFDVVIGNPPYIRIQAMKEWAPVEVEFYKDKYTTARKGNYDIYVVFVERGLQLLRESGRLGMIMPHKFFNAKYGENLRTLIASKNHLSELVHFGDAQVFEDATTYTCLLFLEKSGQEEFRFVNAHDLSSWRLGDSPPALEGNLPATEVGASEWNFVVGPGAGLFKRLQEIPVTLKQLATRMYQGSITSADSVFLFKQHKETSPTMTSVCSQELDEWLELESSILKPVVRSGSIGRYRANPTSLVLFPYDVQNGSATLYSAEEMRRQFPLAWDYLERNRELLEAREKGKFQDSEWYRFGRSQNLAMWEQRKLMLPYMIRELASYYDKQDGYYFINVTTGGYGVTLDETVISYLYLCGLLNSRLLDFFLKRVSTTFRGGYLAANKQFIERLPILVPESKEDKLRQRRIEDLVAELLSLSRKLSEAAGHARIVLERRIEAGDREVNRIINELYGLSKSELLVLEHGGSQDSD